MGTLISQTAGAFGTAVLFDADDPCEFLVERYAKWPANARLFHEGAEVPLATSDDVERLESLSGRFLLAIPAAGPLLILGASLAFNLAVAYLLRPDMPEIEGPKKKRQPQGTPTNALARATNQVRLGERVPDIYGKVRVTPDLLAPTLVLFENGVEVHYNLMCVGRGFNYVTLNSIQDGSNGVEDVPGYSVQVYEPPGTVDGGSTDLSTATPTGTLGKSFDVPNMFMQRIEGAEYESIPPNNYASSDDNSMQSQQVMVDGFPRSGLYPRRLDYVDDLNGHISSKFHHTNDPNDDSSHWYFNYDLAAHYPVGTTFRITQTTWIAGWDDDPVSYDADGIIGTYRVIKAERENLWLDIPANKQTAWNDFPVGDIDDEGGLRTHELQVRSDPPELTYEVARAVSGVHVNFIAPDGLYYHDGRGYVGAQITVQHQWTRLDGGGSVGPYFEDIEVRGGSKNTTGKTVTLDNPWVNGYACRVAILIRRTDPRIPGTVAYRDDGQAGTAPTAENGGTFWTVEGGARIDLHSIYAGLEEPDTGIGENITALVTRVESSFATRGLRNRQLTCLAERKVRVYDFSSIRTPSRSFHHVLYDMVIDPVIGRLDESAVDYAGWTSTYNVLVARFNVGDQDGYKMAYFDHVFDSMDTSFEDMVMQLAANVWCSAYRIGEVIQFAFEKPHYGPYAEMLFNSRNILPDSLKVGMSFGIENQHDCVQVEWRDPDQSDTAREYRIPESPHSEGLTPKDLPLIGVREERKAHIHAWRQWNRLTYIDTRIEFDATNEAALLLPGDIIMVADLTNPSIVIDCDVTNVVHQGGSTYRIYFSRPLVIPDNTSLWLQMPSDSVRDTYVLALDGSGGTYTYIDAAYSWVPDLKHDKENFYRTHIVGYPHTGEADYTVYRHFYRVLAVKPTDKGVYRVEAERYHRKIYWNDYDPI